MSDTAISEEFFLAQVNCLSEAMFFEARGEGPDGLEAVAMNILYRTKIKFGRMSTVCGTVHKYKAYSYLWDNIPDVVLPEEEDLAYEIFLMAADFYIRYRSGELSYNMGACSGATHYHTTDITAWWADDMKVCGVIKGHIFYHGR